MRAAFMGAVAAAAAGAASPGPAEASSRGLACAAPTLFQCAVIAPGFTRYFVAPFGVAPSDGEMAARTCGDKRQAVVSTRRVPTGSGPLSQTTALEVECGSRDAVEPRPAVEARRPIRDFEGERLRGVERRAVPPEAYEEIEDAPRRRSTRRDAVQKRRQSSRQDGAAVGRREPKTQARPQDRAKPAAGLATPAKPVAAPEPRPREADPAPRAASPAPDPKPAAAERPAAPEPKPAPVEPSAPRGKPKHEGDPSIMYDHL